MSFKNHGIPATTLIEQVFNTAPFLFQEEVLANTDPEFRYLQILNDAYVKLGRPVPGVLPQGHTKHSPHAADSEYDQDLLLYFELCLAAHFATVGTFVPTDVDLAIRQKLWNFVYHPQAFEPMWRLVQEFHRWNEAPVSKRVAYAGKKKLSGHQGEWFSVAMGAYGCALKVAHEFIAEIREEIEAQVREHELAITELRTQFLETANESNAKIYFAGIAAVAHNLGDLDRMFDAWEIAETDVLKRRVYRSGHEDARQPRAVLVEAGKIYQDMLANENHRQLALREPKSLRRSGEFLLSYGPFLDEWGERLVKKGLDAKVLSEGDLREIVEALIVGWGRLNQKSMYHSQGYARALCGIMSALPRQRTDLENLVPPVLRKELVQGGLRTLTGVAKKTFENQWMRKLYGHLSSS